MKTCSALRSPTHGRVKCEHDEDYQQQFQENSTVYPIDTRCQFRCDVGYQLRGSKVRNCLPLSRWDGLKVTCKGKKKDNIILYLHYLFKILTQNQCLDSCKMQIFTANRERRHHSGNLHRASEGALCHQLHDHLQRGLHPGRTHRQNVHWTHGNLVPASQR